MLEAGVKVEGGRQFRSTLKRAEIGLDDLKSAHAKAAGIVVGYARPHTPRRSGRLAESVRSTGTGTAAIIRAGFASVPYANPIHWGWPARHIVATPWISRDARASEDVWRQVYEDAVSRLVDRIRGL